mmetsp:Transcript_152264/g.486561  ORF Transcript_152264/g.486561 Transcript_152264/m.486561 type:complete len:220 (+) Transcript_152264:223-882(+)
MIFHQKRIQQQMVEMVVQAVAGVPAPKIQEEIVHVPTILQQKCIQQQMVEMHVEGPVPMFQEEVVHVPKIHQQVRITQQHGEMVVEVPVPMIQENIVQVPKILKQERITQQPVEIIVEVPVPMTQEEIVLTVADVTLHTVAHVIRRMQLLQSSGASFESIAGCLDHTASAWQGRARLALRRGHGAEARTCVANGVTCARVRERYSGFFEKVRQRDLDGG